MDGYHEGRDPLSFHQPTIGFPGGTTCRVYRQSLPPEPLNHAVPVQVLATSRSAVWQQAANRLPTEQAALYALATGWEG